MAKEIEDREWVVSIAGPNSAVDEIQEQVGSADDHGSWLAEDVADAQWYFATRDEFALFLAAMKAAVTELTPADREKLEVRVTCTTKEAGELDDLWW